MLAKERKKQLDQDIWIITIFALLVLCVMNTFQVPINNFLKDESIHIVLRVLMIGGLFQFGLAGLGITIVCIIRKESFLSYGLSVKKLVPTILLSAICCVPRLIYIIASGQFKGWLPFQSVHTTAEILKSGFPYNVIGFLITAICWGFFESFNYVVISAKLNERFPSKIKLLNWGAIICAIMCILVHGAIGVTPDAITDMLCDLILIYGMLLVRDHTDNAWGCVLIFMLFWNAL